MRLTKRNIQNLITCHFPELDGRPFECLSHGDGELELDFGLTPQTDLAAQAVEAVLVELYEALCGRYPSRTLHLGDVSGHNGTIVISEVCHD